MVKLFKLKGTESPAALSPARQKLQDLLDQGAACAKRSASLRLARGRLEGPEQEATAAAAELAEFDRQNAADMAAWARNGITRDARPLVDTDKRQVLIIAKQTTAENAATAKAAAAQLDAEIHSEDRVAKGLEMPIAAAIAEILSETVDPLLVDLQEALRGVFERQSRIKRAIEAVVNIAHSAGDVVKMKPTFDIAQALNERVASAVVPTVDNHAGDMALWTSFALRLRTDAAAELEPR